MIMNKNIIFLNKNEFIYKNNNLELSEVNKVIKQKHRMIVILGENIYIKQVYVKKKKEIEEKLEEMLDEFKDSDDYLFHHEYNKKQKRLKIYAIGGGINTNKLCHKAKHLEIIPFQMFIKNKISNLIKLKDYNCIFYYYNNFYYMSVIDNKIEKGFVNNNIKSFTEEINKIGNNSIVYLDRKLKNTGFKIKSELIDLSGVLK